jgi:hypothetical protein
MRVRFGLLLAGACAASLALAASAEERPAAAPASAPPATAEPIVLTTEQVAGQWSCVHTGGRTRPGAVDRTQATVIGSGDATELGVSPATVGRQSAQIKTLTRSHWKVQGDEIHWEMTYFAITEVTVNGRRSDPGPLNRQLDAQYARDPSSRTNVSKVTEIAEDRIVSTETDGSHSICTRAPRQVASAH